MNSIFFSFASGPSWEGTIKSTYKASNTFEYIQ